jgi:hypothetical protein
MARFRKVDISLHILYPATKRGHHYLIKRLSHLLFNVKFSRFVHSVPLPRLEPEMEMKMEEYFHPVYRA